MDTSAHLWAIGCGHNQHVRHDPPWECRPWVITPKGRDSRLGMRLNCAKCDRGATGPARVTAIGGGPGWRSRPV